MAVKITKKSKTNTINLLPNAPYIFEIVTNLETNPNYIYKKI